MDFRQVLQFLLEIFPQVDPRIVRAATIEHSDDVDAAVEFIVDQVLPSLSGPADGSHTIFREESNETRQRDQKINNQGVEAVQPESVAHGTVMFGDSAAFTSPSTGEAEEAGGGQADKTIIDVEINNGDSSLLILEGPGFCHGPLVNDVNRCTGECEEVSRCSVESADTVSVALESARDMPLSVEENHLGLVYGEFEVSMDHGSEVPKDSNDASGNNEDGTDRLPEKCSEVLACDTGVIFLEENNQPMIPHTRSSYIGHVDLLEDCITDAKNNKKTLVSEMESVVNMMKKAESLEERAIQAKEEASSAGQDMFVKVEELKQIALHAKQANDLQAEEVYGEKAILATEALELQYRLLSLADEGKLSLSVIEEIHETLEARLVAAKDVIAAAEQEKLEKEGLALKALKEQEAVMETIVQESKKLQEQAEENAKLREFLMDRGQVVDRLQGEIDVIHEDVMALKKRVDEGASLKGSLLMSTYSSASSSFSNKSMASTDGLHIPTESDEYTRKSSGDRLTNQEQQRIITARDIEEANSNGKQKPTIDDDWEIFGYDACPF